MTSSRRLAAVGSILIHLLLLAGLSLLVWQPLRPVRDEVELLLEFRSQAQKNVEPASRPHGKRQSRKMVIPKSTPPVVASPGQAIAPRDSLLFEEPPRGTVDDAARQFFGDSLYGILQKYPGLKSLVLQELLVRQVPAYDSLATLRKQIAEALAPYLDMSDAERSARANMKRFGTAHNPLQAPAIPGNIPISAIILFLIDMLK